MQCFQCGFDNKPRKKFCTKCGARLVPKCRQCDAEIEETDDFCGECGLDLRKPAEVPPKELSFDEKLTKIQRYLSECLTEKIISQRDRIEGERRQVTVMFCDLEGFTPLTERLGTLLEPAKVRKELAELPG